MPTRDVAVLVVGAGAAGLATAAGLRRRGVEPVVLDRGHAVGDVWRARYDRLRLHTPRIQSGLPGFAIPTAAGRWVRRDDYADYLAAYARHSGVRPEFDVEVVSVRRDGEFWRVRTRGAGAEFRSRQLVFAAGHAHTALVPDWGAGSIPVRHSSQYTGPAEFARTSVLVVGSGNSGAEIALDLLDGGAREVRWSVRTPPPVVPRSLGPVPSTLLAVLQHPFPAGLADAVNTLAQRVSVGDLTRYGLPRAATGPVTRTRTTGDPPLIDTGVVAALRAGDLRVVPAVQRITGAEVVLADGTTVRPDSVVAATGWTSGLRELLGDLDVLDATGRPRVHADATWPHTPGLRFVGYRIPARGALFEIARDARRAARAVAQDVEAVDGGAQQAPRRAG